MLGQGAGLVVGSVVLLFASSGRWQAQAVGGAVAVPAVLPLVVPPEVPAISRNLSMVEKDAGGVYRFQNPVIPAMRTANDGRVAVNLTRKGPFMAFYLLAPEKLGAPLVTGPDGNGILAATQFVGIADSLFHNHSGNPGIIAHSTLCDATPQFPAPGEPTNPYPCQGNPSRDCYDLTVISSYHFFPVNDHIELWGTPVRIEVSNPKTAAAQIALAVTTGPPVLGVTFPGVQALFEPMITKDGRLLTGRVAGSPLAGYSGTFDLVYSVYPESFPACDVTRWTAFHPIAHAPFDGQMTSRYPLAFRQFRDTEGTLIPDGVDIKGSYPWVDRDGDNVFMTTVAATNFYWHPAAGQVKERYPASCVPGVACQEPTTSGGIFGFDEPSNTRGVAVAGLWTHGKMVLLDGILNHTDFGFPAREEFHRVISLYQPNTGPLGTESGAVRVGAGRDASPNGGPPGYVDNTTFLDSTEHLLNAKSKLRPITPRDVVWIVNSGRVSDEVGFDDWVHPGSFIVSEMTASLSWGGGPVASHLHHHDGFKMLNGQPQQGSGFGDPVRVQNSATGHAFGWSPPPYGLAYGNLRIEPVAMGGIRGRGLWLDGSSGVRYDVSAQTPGVSTRPWYVGLFVDCRFADNAQRRRVLTFPDGTRLELQGRSQVLFVDAAGTTLATFALPVGSFPTGLTLPLRGWAHLGLVVGEGGFEVDLYVNGFRFGEWSSAGSQTLFQLVPGPLFLGKPQGTTARGFLGWVDELKVIAGDPGPEVACNQAHGSLLGLSDGYSGPWATQAALYPASSHAEITQKLVTHGYPSFGEYACLHDYTVDHGADLGTAPAGTVSQRQPLLFPEGPLHFGQIRPSSRANFFCTSCHVGGLPPSLSPSALSQGQVSMEDDPRRQPHAPLRLIFGTVPAHYVGPGLPATPQVAPPEGIQEDQWVFPP